MQLLAVAFPSLQRMQEEEGGQEKMARITRYVTVGLAVFQAIGLSRAGAMSAPAGTTRCWLV